MSVREEGNAILYTESPCGGRNNCRALKGKGTGPPKLKPGELAGTSSACSVLGGVTRVVC